MMDSLIWSLIFVIYLSDAIADSFKNCALNVSLVKQLVRSL